MTNHRRQGFTMAEVLTTLGIIGVLCVTMLSLTNVGENKYNLAATKLAQTEAALKSWGMAQSGANETGLGTFAIINSQVELEQAILKTLNNPSLTVENSNTKNSKIDMGNGVEIYPVFKTSDCDTTTHCATVKVASNVNGESTITEEYAIFSDGVKSVKEMYLGYEQCVIVEKEITFTYADGEKETKKCPTGVEKCVIGACTAPDQCATCPPTIPAAFANLKAGESFFVQATEKRSCDNPSDTGYVEVTVADSLETGDPITTEINKCCPNPTVYYIDENGVADCVCPPAAQMAIEPGHIYSASADTCQVKCDAGSVPSEDKLSCEKCKAGTYSDVAGATECTPCPRGSYCPGDGATEPTDCVAGYFCNANGLAAPENCPKGYYCDGTGDADKIACEPGYANSLENQTSASACIACGVNEFASEAGSATCSNCPSGSGTEGKTAQTSCSSCPLGQEYNDQGICTPCAAGKYGTIENGVAVCKPCAAGSYTDKPGQLECILCPAGKYAASAGSTSCTLCPQGTANGAIGQASCTACLDGTYSNTTGATICTPCLCGTYSKDTNKNDNIGPTACITVEPGYYPVDAGNAYIETQSVEKSACGKG